MHPDFETLKRIIQERRTIKAATMNGKQVPDGQIKELLQLAAWAPTHGRTEPWRFFVYGGAALKQFGQAHADLYLGNIPEEKQKPDAPAKLKEAVERPSHLIIVAMKKGDNPKIPALEEAAAVSAAIQNILLGAEALGIAAIWNSGGMTHHKAMKELLGLGEEDIVMGLIYLGYTDEQKRAGKRNIPIEEKTIWMK